MALDRDLAESKASFESQLTALANEVGKFTASLHEDRSIGIAVGKQFLEMGNKSKKAFEDFAKSEDKSDKGLKKLNSQILKNVDQLKSFAEAGRLTEAGMAALDKQIKKSKSQDVKNLKLSQKLNKEVRNLSKKNLDSLKDSIQGMAKHIPLFGEKIAEGLGDMFKKIAPKLSGILEKGYIKMFSKKGGAGGGMSMLKMGVWGAVAAAILMVIKLLMKIDGAFADIAKKTGHLRSDLGEITKGTAAMYADMVKYGMTMDEAVESSATLVNEMGSIHRVTSEMIDAQGRMVKMYGLSNEEAAHLNKTLFSSNLNAQDLFKAVEGFAGKGVSANIIMRDIARNTNFMALHAGKGAAYFAEVATNAALMGTSIGESQTLGEGFLDWETSMSKTLKLNYMLGSNLNAANLRDLAIRGEGLQIQEKIQAAIKNAGGWEKLTLQRRREIASITGQTLEDLQYQNSTLEQRATIDKEREARYKASMNQRAEDAMTILQKLRGTIESMLAKGIVGGFTAALEKLAENPFWGLFFDTAEEKTAAATAARAGKARANLHNMAIDDAFGQEGSYPKDYETMAKGGIVTGPTRALIGEAGPEMVIPLTRKMGGLVPTMPGTVSNPLRMAAGGVALDAASISQAMTSNGRMQNAASPGEQRRMQAQFYEQNAQILRAQQITNERLAGQLEEARDLGKRLESQSGRSLQDVIKDFLKRKLGEAIHKALRWGVEQLSETQRAFIDQLDKTLHTDREHFLENMALLIDRGAEAQGNASHAMESLIKFQKTSFGSFTSAMVGGAGLTSAGQSAAMSEQATNFFTGSANRIGSRIKRIGTGNAQRLGATEGAYGELGGGAAGRQLLGGGIQSGAGGLVKRAAGSRLGQQAVGMASSMIPMIGPMIGPLIAQFMPQIADAVKKLPKILWKGIKAIPDMLKKVTHTLITIQLFLPKLLIKGVAAIGKALKKGLGKLKFWAAGGIVDRPTMGVMGEEGREAIIPIDRIRRGEPVDAEVAGLLGEMAGGRAARSSGGSSGSGSSAALLQEISALREAITMLSNRPVVINLDGKKIAEVTASHFEEMSWR